MINYLGIAILSEASGFVVVIKPVFVCLFLKNIFALYKSRNWTKVVNRQGANFEKFALLWQKRNAAFYRMQHINVKIVAFMTRSGFTGHTIPDS